MRVSVQCKLDGISAVVTYLDGKLFSLVTRGDGTRGDDITVHAEHFQDIPLEIPDQGRVDIRGELIMEESVFQENWVGKWQEKGLEKAPSNARNSVAGLCKGRSKPEDLNDIRFVAYDYYGPKRRDQSLKSETEILAHLEETAFRVPALKETVESVAEAVGIYENYDQGGGREKIPYKTDGLVIKLDDLKQQEFFPVEVRPKWATAIKPSSKSVATVVIGLIWSMGLSGRFSPVAQVEPRDLDGVCLKNLNMHNLENLEEWHKKGFGIGAQVLVERAGDVIPNLVDVISPA